MKKCFKCESEMDDDSVFCPNCGEKVEEGTTETQGSADAEEVETVTDSDVAAETESSEAVIAESDISEEVVSESEVSAEPASESEVSAEPVAVEEVKVETPAAAIEPTPAIVENKPENSGNGKKIGIIAGAVAAVAVIGVVAATMIPSPSKDPKNAVVDAFKSIYASEAVMPIEEIFGFTEMGKYAQTQNTETNMNLKLESSIDPSLAMLNGSGIEIIGKSDITNKKFFATVGVQYQNMDLAHADMYLDETNIMVSVPELSKKVFSLNYAEDLEGQIKKSPYLGEQITYSGVDIGAFDEYMQYIMSFYDKDKEDMPFDLTALWNRYKEGSKAIEEFKTAMTVEKGDKVTKIVDGKDQECQGYDVTITKEASLEYLRTSIDFFMEDETLKKDVAEYLTQVIQLSQGMGGYNTYGMDAEEAQEEAWEDAQDNIDQFLEDLEEMMGDVTMTVYVDKAGRMAALEATTDLTDEYDEVITLDLNVALKGGEYLTQNADVVLKLTNEEDETVEMTMYKKGTYDKKILTSNIELAIEIDEEISYIEYNGSYQVEDGAYEMKLSFSIDDNEGFIALDGFVTDLEKGKSFAATADSIIVSYDGLEVVELSGSYGMKPLADEVTIPEGEKMDILAATEKEWTDVQTEMMMGVFSLYSKLQ